jgi:hypothetical protein
VFEVTGVAAGEGLWLRDLASQGEYAVSEREASQLLTAGDLLVGRLFPIGDGLHHISRAASFYRNPELLSALRLDLDRARESRRGVLRLTQSEIEAMFYAPREESPSPDAVGAARQLLLNGGLGAEDIDEILQQLASETFSASAILPGAHDTLGEVLDRLAFESNIDLEAARRVLLRAWEELSRSGPGRGPSLSAAPTNRVGVDEPAGTPEMSAAEALAAYERQRKNGADLDRAFQVLEKALALSGGGDAADEEETPAPDFPGVVGAMIEEFLWESEHELGPQRARELECLRSFGRFANSIGVFENLSAQDLREYTCRWLPESEELGNADEARRLLSALHQFCRWTEENHDVQLYSEFKSILQNVETSLPRLVEANRRRTRHSEPARGMVYECLALPARSRARVRDLEGREREVDVDADLVQWLQAGDRVRGSILADGRMAVYCCYPREAELGPPAR